MSAALATEDKGTRVPVEVESNDAVAKALGHVNAIVERIAGLVPAKTTKAAGPEDEEAPAGDEPGDDSEEVAVEKATMKSVLQACGMSQEQMKKAMGMMKAAGFDPNQKFPTAQKPVAKAAEPAQPAAPAAPAQTETPFTMEGFADAVKKAASFTPARIAQLKQAHDVLKLVLEAVAPDASPQNNLPQVAVHPNVSGISSLSSPEKTPVVKSAEGAPELVEVLKNLGEGIGKLTERVEAIEKVRPASNSVADAGGTESKTQKSAGLWLGVL